MVDWAVRLVGAESEAVRASQVVRARVGGAEAVPAYEQVAAARRWHGRGGWCGWRGGEGVMHGLTIEREVFESAVHPEL